MATLRCHVQRLEQQHGRRGDASVHYNNPPLESLEREQQCNNLHLARLEREHEQMRRGTYLPHALREERREDNAYNYAPAWPVGVHGGNNVAATLTQTNAHPPIAMSSGRAFSSTVGSALSSMQLPVVPQALGMGQNGRQQPPFKLQVFPPHRPCTSN